MAKAKKAKRYVTVYKPVCGYKPVHVWFNTDGKFWEPWETYHTAYHTQAAATVAGEEWAKELELPFVAPPGLTV